MILIDYTGREHPKNFKEFLKIAKDHKIEILKETTDKIWFVIDGHRSKYYKNCTDNKTFYKRIVHNHRLKGGKTDRTN